MAHIKISKGLDIPIKGKPRGDVEPLILSGTAAPQVPKQIALDLTPFENTKFKVLVSIGESVKIGQPLVEDKSLSGRMFCSPAAGTVAEVRRGHRRILTAIVIDVAAQEEYFANQMPQVSGGREALVESLKQAGFFAHIRSRPFNQLADPTKIPRSIFVKAIESAPLVPPAEMQVEGHEEDFEAGLKILKRLTDGPVHLIYRKDTACRAFSEAVNVAKTTAEGPHPIANASLHIQCLDPITSPDDQIWTLDAHDVVAIGHWVNTGHYYVERVVSIAGPGVIEERIGYFKTREGIPVSNLISGRVARDLPVRLISGDPLMGKKVTANDFLGFNHFALSVIPEGEERQFLHFFRPGFGKYSFSKAYVSGHLNNEHREYEFTTSQHGEHRPFIDPTLIDQVQPLPISTMLLVKAVMAEDFELAEQLGLVTVDSEDFALPTFVCPSKMEMTEIIKDGLNQYALDMAE